MIDQIALYAVIAVIPTVTAWKIFTVRDDRRIDSEIAARERFNEAFGDQK